MKNFLRIAVVALLFHSLCYAQPKLGREELRRVPREDAVVLDPVGSWQFVDGSQLAWHVSLDQESGHPKMKVLAPGKRGSWHRSLGIPFDPQRYPIAILRYRATGVLPSNQPVFQLGVAGGGSLAMALNQDLVADGEEHELVVDLRELDPQGAITRLTVLLACKGPEPATLALLGIRFDSDHELPPLAEQEELAFSLRVVNSAGTGVEGATVTVDAERLNWSRSAKTDALGKATLWAADNPSDEHTLRVSKEGMATAQLQTGKQAGGQDTVTLLRGAHYGGIVRNEEGQPIANAAISIRARAGEQVWHNTLLTDAAGRWRTSLLPAARVSFYARLRHPDYLAQTINASPTEEMLENTAVLVMRSGGIVRGIVLGPDGRPVAGARVVPREQVKRQHFRPFYRDLRRVATDAAGRFAFAERQLGTFMLSVQSAGLAPAMVPLEVAVGMADVTVRLEPGQTIRGRVVDLGGVPLAGVGVAAREWRGFYDMSWRATTDAEGRFAWRGAPKDAVSFDFSKKGYMKLKRHSLTASEEEHEIVLPPVGRVTGTVTDAETGRPVTSFIASPGYVRSLPNSSAAWGKEKAEPATDGRYGVAFDLVSAQFQVRIEAAGYAPGLSPRYSLEKLPRTIDFQLRKAAEITGTVRLPDGNPAQGANVHLVPRGGFTVRYPADTVSPHFPACKTKADGRYRFPEQKGNWLLVAVHPSGYAETIPPKHAESPELKLEAWARIEGVYRIGTGPAAGCPVGVAVGRRWEGLAKPFGYPRVSHHGLDSRTDEEGRFVIDHVPPGKATVGPHIAYYGSVRTMSDGRKLDLRPGETRQVVIGGTGRPVIGQLTAVNGTVTEDTWRLTGILVREAYNPRHPEVTRKTYVAPVSADGSFRVEDIPAENYTLRATIHAVRRNGAGDIIAELKHNFTVPEMPGGRSDLPLDLGTLDIQLPKVTEITGIVRLPDGKPADGASVFLATQMAFHIRHPVEDMSPSPSSCKTKADGRYRFPWDKGNKGTRGSGCWWRSIPRGLPRRFRRSTRRART